LSGLTTPQISTLMPPGKLGMVTLRLTLPAAGIDPAFVEVLVLTAGVSRDADIVIADAVVAPLLRRAVDVFVTADVDADGAIGGQLAFLGGTAVQVVTGVGDASRQVIDQLAMLVIRAALGGAGIAAPAAARCRAAGVEQPPAAPLAPLGAAARRAPSLRGRHDQYGVATAGGNSERPNQANEPKQSPMAHGGSRATAAAWGRLATLAQGVG
jgi:hypothetical protein